MKRKVIVSVIIILFSLVLWWAKSMYFLPHFQEGPKNTLVSKNMKLELVTDSTEPEKLGISVP